MPNLLTQKKFDFVSQSPELAPDAFTVVEFKGFEGFSTCYQFEITLVGVDPEIDIDGVLEFPATFTILRDEGDIPFHGILTEFEQLHAIDDYVVFRTVLAPKLWWLSLTRHNQVFLDKTVPEVLAAVLTDGGLTPDDFELRLMNEGVYEPWEFICQYGESHLNFVSRWMEREGMYFYFEQGPSGEKVIVTDTSLSHDGMAEGRTMYYLPPSGLDEPFREEVIHAFICKQKLLPGKVQVQDYNYRNPTLNLTAEAEVSARGRGAFHVYGDHFRTAEEGDRLADMRSQELRSHEKRFHGESTIPYLRPGYLFDLERHYRAGFNQQYLTIELSHAGSQTGFLISGIGRTLSESEKRPYYRNSFVSIPAEIPYRHPKSTEKPRFYGTINATVDAEGSGEYAELDGHGRYKVRLPFDLSGREGGKASHWVRMAQPYAGTDHGMHFPLHKGTEVLLSFIEGDPDRPLIAAAVPNPETPSVIQDENHTKAAITTSGQNKIHFEDQAGNQRILMHSPTANSWVRIGSHNDPPNPYYVSEGDEISKYIDSSGEWVLFNNEGETIESKKADSSLNDVYITYRNYKEFKGEDLEGLGIKKIIRGNEYSIDGMEWRSLKNQILAENSSGVFEFYRDKTVVLKVDDWEGVVDLDDPGSGVRIRSENHLWLESEGKYANYIAGAPVEGDGPSKAIEGLRNKMFKRGSNDFKPKGMLPYNGKYDSSKTYKKGDLTIDGGGNYWRCLGESQWEKLNDDQAWKQLVNSGQVKLSKLDTFNTQEGNIYDFGGYWNYNLGNSYAEEHIDQSANLNTLKNGEVSIENFAPKDPNFSAPNQLGEAITISAGCATIISASIAAQTSMGAKGVGASVATLIGAIQSIGQGFLILCDQDKDLSDAPRMIQNEDQCNLGDIVTCPNFGNIKTWAGKVGSSFNFPDGDVPYENEEQLQQLSGKEFYNNAEPMHTATTWVSKNFGDSYSFTKGNSIEIANGSIETHNHGNTYEFTYGGRHEEHRFSGGGGQVYYSCSEGGQSFEQKWTPSGNIVSIDYKDASVVWGQGLAYAFSSTHTGKIDVSFAMGVSASISASADAHLNISSSLGANFNIESAAAANFNIKFGGAANFTIENDKMETNIVGLREIKSGKYIKNVGLEKKNALESIKTAAKDISNGDKKIDTFSNAVLAAMNILLG